MLQVKYGVFNNTAGEIWRDHFETEQEAVDWVNTWLEDGGNPRTFTPIKAVVEWEPVDGWN